MNKKILIVDDDLSIRTLAEYYLIKEGYLVSQAEDGLEALQKLASEQFDLILTDMMMPKMNGLELIEAVRAKDSRIPIVMFTAAGSGNLGENRKKAEELHANGFLLKPFSREDLTTIIAKNIS